VTAHDAVVVGAGLAGLRAAQVLARRGLDVVVLEAADRPGGRVATDVVDGFRLDRGFQVLNTSYPALRAAADLDALDLRPFVPGAAIRGADGRAHVFAHPVRRPSLLWATTADPLLPPLGKAKLVAWTARVLASPPRRTAGLVDRSAAQDLAAAGLDGPVVERFLRPFLSGVLADRELVTSAAFVRLVWRSFALGTIAVPGTGVGALPAQLAAPLAVRCGVRVAAVRPGAVDTADGTVAARAVVVATDPVTAADLLPGLDAPRMRALTTYYHVPPAAPAREPLLHLDGTGGPVANTVVLTAAAPGYSADGRPLVSSTVVGPALPEPEVRRELGRVWGASTAGWEHLRTVEVTRALPEFRPGRGVRSAVELGDGLFVAGDHRDTPSSQGALVSGRRAAEAVLSRLGVR
jgi:glycine/D-amino acid oxidase-like deaminating enzyme